MSNPATPARIRQDADAVATHESYVKGILAKPHKMNEAVSDFLTVHSNSLELAQICLVALTDEAEAGRQLKKFAENAAHECARWWMGDDAEVIEPAPTYKPSFKPVDMLKLAGEICAPHLPQTLQRAVDGARGISPEKVK